MFPIRSARSARFDRGFAATGLLAAAALLISACSSSSASGATSASVSSGAPAAASGAALAASSGASTGGSTAASGHSTVTLSVTDIEGCVATPNTVPAGTVTFNVKNVDATGITELELTSQQRIVGELENLTPGFSSTFTVKVNGGAYQIYCPGGPAENVPFTVTGKLAAPDTLSSVNAALQQAAMDYATYVDNQIEFLIPPVEDLVAAVKAGNVAAAQAAYAKARPFYERIEPVAESFPDLDAALDRRIGDVAAGTAWTGFHPIEKGLFMAKSTNGLDPLAQGLLANLKNLQAKATQLTTATTAGKSDGYQPFEIANGASALLDEVLQTKITGEEEAYSHIDLLDFEANVEGSLQALATLEPALNQIDPKLAPAVSAKFTALTTLLDSYRDPKALGGWTTYPDLSAADKKKLTDALLAVQEPLSAIAAKITK